MDMSCFSDESHIRLCIVVRDLPSTQSQHDVSELGDGYDRNEHDRDMPLME